MRDDRPTPFLPWTTTIPAIPPRTRLYHLPPVGIGTGTTESLTSYLIRLAEAHCVPVGTLIAREIAPLVAAHSHVRSLAQHNWVHYSHALNGTGATAQTLVDVLQRLTGRHDLHLLTLLPWSHVLPPLGLLRRERAWCPACYQEWRENGQPVYDPLLWALRVVTSCSRHRQELETRCPACQCSQAALATMAQPGACAHCLHWFGRAAHSPAPLSPWTCWATEVVATMLAATPTLTTPPDKEQLREAIDRYAIPAAGEDLAMVAERAHISPSHLWAWRSGCTTPTLPLLLRLCASLGMTPLQLLTPTPDADLPLPARQVVPPPKRPRPPRNGDDHATIRQRVATLARPDAIPPPSLRQIAEAVGHTEGTLRRVCPELSADIVERWRTYRHTQRLQRERELTAAIRQAMLQVHAQGLPLTTKRVSALLPHRACFRAAVARQAWKDTLRELELGP
jgi:transcriptional regulator with XRE-family HTH domain